MTLGCKGQPSVRSETKLVLLFLDKLQQFFNFHRRFRMEKHQDSAFGDADLLNQKLLEQTSQVHDQEKVLYDHRGGAKAVLYFLFEFFQLQRCAQARQPFVKIESLIGVRNVVFREISWNAHADFGLHFRRHRFAAKLAHRFFHHFRIELESDGRNLTGLLLSQKIARATDLKIVERKLESTAQTIEFLECP